MKLGIIVDSACGLTKMQANKRNWGFAPIIVTINGQDYNDGVNIDAKSYYKIIDINSDIKTATTPLGDINSVLEKASKKFDYIIVYPISNELSAQTNNFTRIAKKFKNVFVIPSNSVGYAIVKDCEILEQMAHDGKSWEEIKNYALKLTRAHFGLAAPKTMKWLVKGGRVSGTTASMAKLLKIVPIIQIKNGKLEKFGKGRIFEKTVEKMARFLKDKYKANSEKYCFSIYHGDNKAIATIAKNINEYIPISDTTFFPPAIGGHIGPGVVAIVAHLKH